MAVTRNRWLFNKVKFDCFKIKSNMHQKIPSITELCYFYCSFSVPESLVILLFFIKQMLQNTYLVFMLPPGGRNWLTDLSSLKILHLFQKLDYFTSKNIFSSKHYLGNVIKLSTTVTYCHSLVLMPFCCIK